MNELDAQQRSQVAKSSTDAEGLGFAQLGINQAIVKVMRDRGIEQPALVQQAAIPPIMEGKSAIVHSGTGTGKTLAYVLPLLERVDLDAKQVHGLVIVPTQELAMQIVREIEALVGSKVIALIGGASLQRQVDRLKKHYPIVVGTPGRLVELYKLRKLKLGFIRYAVIDEVDQVFALGAQSDVDTLLHAVPKDRQLVFVTATVTADVEQSARRWMTDYTMIRGQSQAEATAGITHEYLTCAYRDKVDMLRRLIRTLKPDAALIFVRDTDVIGELEAKLKYAGLQVESLYGDAGKQERASVMKRYVSGKLRLLLATDVAARGIDVMRISHVINFEPPIDAKQYIHRAGRTGRMGRSGAVITLATEGERSLLRRLADKLGIELKHKALSYGEWVDADSVIRERGSRKAAQTVRERPVETHNVSPVKGRMEPPGADAKGRAEVRSGVASPLKAQNKRDRDRKRDRKNKGAPRWLKEKRGELDPKS